MWQSFAGPERKYDLMKQKALLKTKGTVTAKEHPIHLCDNPNSPEEQVHGQPDMVPRGQQDSK